MRVSDILKLTEMSEILPYAARPEPASATTPARRTLGRQRIVALRSLVTCVSITRRPVMASFRSARPVRLRLWFTSVVLLASLTGAAPLAVAAADVTVSNERFSFVGDTIAGCNGEDISAQFYVHNVDVLVFNSAGGVTVRSHQDVHGTAIGSLGNTYVLAGIQANLTIINPDALGLREFTVTNQLHNVSRGGADNLLVIAVTHTTLNANGDVTSEVTNLETRCVG
jgi:hypothetical protein